ncbi:MAG: ABC transporter substrate-binding protein [Planctomycetes bacterium]|nr:ABC transporter substrate-binding protein [Planctomycetota bacterium]MCP4770974.1 ABC transporter substrate-binding protein [Planctomycetota bacterium]
MLCSLLLLPFLCAPSAAPAQEVSEAAQSVKFAISREPQGFDPVRNTELIDASLQSQVLECLVEYDYLAGDQTVMGQLAESWSVSEDGLEWRFQLREDARFHDPFDPPLWPSRSRTVTAHDVLYSWLRQADARWKSGGFWSMDGILVGIEDYRRATGSLDPQQAASAMTNALRNGIDGIQVLGDHELLVRLQQPDPNFLNRLAMSYFMVYPYEAVTKDGRSMRDQPVGSGPFQVKEWLPGQTLILQQTPAWRTELSPFGDGATLPYLDQVEFHVVRDRATGAEIFRRGEVARLGVNTTGRNVFMQDGLKLKPEYAQAGLQMYDNAAADLTMLCFGMEDPVIGDLPGDEEGNRQRRLLRRALALAFPYDMWNQVFRATDFAIKADSFLPPMVPGSSIAPACQWNHKDLEQAKQLLQEAGYPNGKGLEDIEFVLSGKNQYVVDLGLAYQQNLSEIGVRLKLVPLAYEDQLKRSRNADAQIVMRTWVMNWPDGALMLQNFHGPQVGIMNYSAFRDPQFDELFSLYRQTTEGKERDQLLLNMLQILEEQVPAIPIDHRRNVLLVQPWLQNFRYHPFQSFFCKYYSVSEH